MDQQIKECDGLMELLETLEQDGVTGLQKQEAYKTFLNFQARMRGKVYTGGFELTPLCNFDCKMCYVHLSKEQQKKEAAMLTTEQWIDIIRQAIEAGMMHADLTGGECLSYPGFKDIYLYLVSHGVEVSVLTNGQLIDDEMADFFAMYPPAIVQITIYGSNEDAYEQVTGRRAFGDVMAAIERLKQRGIRMLLTTTPSKYMQEDTHALLEMLRSLNVRYAIGTGSLQARSETGKQLRDYAPEVDLYAKLHLDDQEYHKANADRMIPVSEKRAVYAPKGFQTRSKIPCSSGQCTFHVNWKGEMTPCIPFHTVRKSLLENDFTTCWEWIKKKMQEFEPPEKCGKCPNLSVCAACPAERTQGVLNGPLNVDVCDRIQRYLDAGIIKMPQEHSC